jgi:hypothetical protein
MEPSLPSNKSGRHSLAIETCARTTSNWIQNYQPALAGVSFITLRETRVYNRITDSVHAVQVIIAPSNTHFPCINAGRFALSEAGRIRSLWALEVEQTASERQEQDDSPSGLAEQDVTHGIHLSFPRSLGAGCKTTAARKIARIMAAITGGFQVKIARMPDSWGSCKPWRSSGSESSALRGWRGTDFQHQRIGFLVDRAITRSTTPGCLR